MRICIFGAGAVGSHLAVRLSRAGHEVCCVMRGSHLDAARAKGLTLRAGNRRFSARVTASDDPAALGPQDVVISTLKATGLSSLVGGLRPLLGEDTAMVFAQNGIPRLRPRASRRSSVAAGPRLLDPGGRLRAAIPETQIIGGVIFSSNEVVARGIVVNLSLDRNLLLIGERDDRRPSGSPGCARRSRRLRSVRRRSPGSGRRSGPSSSPTCRCRCCVC